MPPPEFRDDPRTMLAASAREFYRRGWMLGTAGNLSARLPDHSFWITASGRPKDLLTEADFVRLEASGRVLEAADGRRPSAEAAIHQVLYRHFAEARWVFHVHSVEANLCGHFARDGALRLPPLEMLKGLGVAEAEPEVFLPVFPNFVDVAAIAAAMDEAFTRQRPRVPGVLIHRHGLTAWGGDAHAARHHLELLEYCFRYLVQARSLALGE